MTLPIFIPDDEVVEGCRADDSRSSTQKQFVPHGNNGSNNDA